MRQCPPVTLPRASRHPGSAMRASAQPLHRLAALALTLCLAIFLGLWARRQIENKRRARHELIVRDYEMA